MRHRTIEMRMRPTLLLRPILVVTLAISSLMAPNASAENAASFPSRSIGIVVPFAPGGAADILARTTAKFASTKTGWQFHVENVSGESRHGQALFSRDVRSDRLPL
jgi:hypothetical protein